MKTWGKWLEYAEQRPNDIKFIVSHRDYFIDDENTEFFYMDFLNCVHLLELDVLEFLTKGYKESLIIEYIKENIANAEMLYTERVIMYFIERGKTYE